ncbi:baseplate J/gp47 family protein [Rhizobium tumorigenes]|uniref:baseplate J/gp47 family protein n=1 Tax=Rhizobium tumorigenes TaxID=2041385 RepID=UPI00241FC875|nr:baseplate J/gp47 family protein [Rhizobium tumorigenes]WFS01583.1 baseplate J/gp47 family protein [Rhizobium tumorigenes]
MAWLIRSLDDASARMRGAFRQYLPGTDTALKNNFVTVTGKVITGLAHEFELRMAYLSKQLFISTATGAYLVMHCADIGIFRKPASAATGAIGISDTSNALATPLTTYPQGIRFISGSDTYLSTAPATSDAAGNLSLSLRSETRRSAANRDAGGLLALADPVLYPDLPTQWSVAAGGLGGGADIELDEDLRARGLQRKRNPPAGGALADYERITLAVPGVLAAWAFRGASPGSVFVFFLFKGRTDFIPQPSDVAVVQAEIDATRLIRVDDSVAVAPTPRPINVTISGLSSDTTEIRAAIEASIRAMFLARCRPGIAGNTFTVSASWINEAISTTTGEDRHVMVAPSADIVLTNGQFPTLGTMTYAA